MAGGFNFIEVYYGHTKNNKGAMTLTDYKAL